MTPYSSDEIRANLEPLRKRLFAVYAEGRPDGWSCDQRTRDMICLGGYMNDVLIGLQVPDDDRRTQMHQYNRRSRSELDLFALVAEILNDTVAGNIARNRIPHRRWG